MIIKSNIQILRQIRPKQLNKKNKEKWMSKKENNNNRKH